MTAPRSSTLFHFTSTLDFLKGILTNGFYPRYCLEDTRWLGVDFTPVPMCCFCDIPISRVSEHTSFYGQYGIGMTKDWGLRNSLQPLIYTPNFGAVAKILDDILNMSDEDIAEIDIKFPIVNHFRAVTTLCKPLSGNMVIAGNIIEKEFYQENEWRFVPPRFPSLIAEEFDHRRSELNEAVAQYALKFTPSDVRYIFVKSEAEIPHIFDFIQQNLGIWPHNDIKILTSRITSLDTIGQDV